MVEDSDEVEVEDEDDDDDVEVEVEAVEDGEEEGEEEEEVEVVSLHLSSRNCTGYTGVHRHDERYEARRKELTIGHYDTAVEAALAYANSSP